MKREIPEAVRRKMCLDKRRYDSAIAARLFGSLKMMRAYHCPVCGKWHLTNPAKKVRIPAQPRTR